MASKANHWKLGLFVVLGLLVAFLGVVVLGASRFDKATLPFVTYFDESVQGLDIGSPVKFRGVKIGSVSRIAIGPERRRVEVTCQVDLGVLDRLGLSPAEDQVDGDFVPADMRVQLISPGITGQKFIQADFFDPKEHPAPGLPFPTPANYIPATSSTLKSIEESVMHALGELPEIIEQVRSVLSRVDGAVGDADVKGISARLTTTLDDADIVLKKADATLDGLGLEAAVGGFNKTMNDASEALARMTAAGGLIDDLEQVAKALRALELEGTVKGVDKALASVDESATVVGDVARDASNLGRDLESTLEAIRLAAESIRRLADTLERDSDMLLKGRARKGD